MTDRYAVPGTDAHQTREEISRSRFVTTIAPAFDVAAAQDLVARLRLEYADATHHCWAFVVGPPGSTARVGMSDDGEPHGTAGRPMLNALLHSGIGDVVAVVTRYYGGVKLGTGGLVRAYGGCLQRALATLPRTERVRWATCRVAMAYADVSAVQQALSAHGGHISAEQWAEDAVFEVTVPDGERAAFAAAVRDATRGRAQVTGEEGAPR